MQFWRTLDSFVSALAVIGIAIGFAHLASGDAFGMPTTSPLGILLWGTRRQPTQVYEILLALVIFAIVMLKFVNRWISPAGISFLAYVTMVAGSRLFLEAFRGDSTLIGGRFRTAQIFAWGILAASLLGIGYLKRARPLGRNQ
jgi:prolipoprotein diacylglyceryltransferase